ncbi:hypothetical protein [Streptomyces sp. NPDC051561]|uniref:hypothetical protein n=1 Tax=Streptomyces sp. NPDC051561 TaxID=3365658 RepID=UPI0037A2D904
MTTNEHTPPAVDPDEYRIRSMLRRRVDGTEPLPQQPPLRPGMIPAPPAYPPTVPTPAADTAPARGGSRLPDWRRPKPALVLVKEDEPEDDEPEPDQDDEPEGDDPDGDEPVEQQPDPKKTPATKKSTPPHVVEIRGGIDDIAKSMTTDPKQRRRIAVGIYNIGAAGIGYAVGIVPWAVGRLLFYGRTDPREGVVIGAGLIVVCAVAEIRTHRWRSHDAHLILRVVGWIARIPLASAVLALALYGPNATL